MHAVLFDCCTSHRSHLYCTNYPKLNAGQCAASCHKPSRQGHRTVPCQPLLARAVVTGFHHAACAQLPAHLLILVLALSPSFLGHLEFLLPAVASTLRMYSCRYHFFICLSKHVSWIFNQPCITLQVRRLSCPAILDDIFGSRPPAQAAAAHVSQAHQQRLVQHTRICWQDLGSSTGSTAVSQQSCMAR